jgi:hypothetical protein
MNRDGHTTYRVLLSVERAGWLEEWEVGQGKGWTNRRWSPADEMDGVVKAIGSTE